MVLTKQGNVVLTLFVVCCILCSGCISDGDSLEPVPDGVDTTPILASDLQTSLLEYQQKYESKGIEMQDMLYSLQEMAREPEPDIEAIKLAYEQYRQAMMQYQRVELVNYYETKVLLEHTTPTEDGLLEIRKDTLPFSPGKVYSYGNVSLAGESFCVMARFHIGKIFDEADAGKDVREALIDAFERLEDTAEGYLDMEIGYVSYYLSDVLVRQSQYSDILIRDCNRICI